MIRNKKILYRELDLISGKPGTNTDRLYRWLTVLLLAAFFICGLRIFRDYGASSDEINQIEAGHIIWATICEKLGEPVPSGFEKLPKIQDYYNRYYGQAATFPTVIIEALRGFQMDISSVVRLRHFWNFLLYFCGMCCLGLLAYLRFRNSGTVFLLLLIHILTPRLFGDAIYNDRDALLVALFWIAMLCFEFFRRKPGIITALLCAFFFSLTINTRYFALVLLILPFMLLFSREEGNKGYTWLLIGLIPIIFFILSPVFWDSFFQPFAASFKLFSSGTQRTQETAGLATILFFGNPIPENKLPFYYLPLWIFISTPLAPQLLTGIGLITSIRKKANVMDRFMRMLLCLGIAAVIIIRPVLYNGWRHMYFFYVPIFWFAGTGINWLFNNSRKWIRLSGICLVLFSAGFTAVRIIQLHPYEYIYLNPLFQSREGDFDRDYWRLSTSEALKWIAEQEQDEVRVSDTNAAINNSIISLFPQQRKHLLISQYNALHRIPADYLIFNYSGASGSEQKYPLFDPAYVIERDGIKLAEVYNREAVLTPSIKSIQPDIPEITDGIIDFESEWRSAGHQTSDDEIVIEFSEITRLRGLSLLPGDDENEYARTPEVSISDDGKNWQAIPLTVSDLFDLSFPPVETKWLRIRNTDSSDVHWSIREICFYK